MPMHTEPISDSGQGSGASIPTREAIQAWLVTHLAEALVVDTAEIDCQVPFADYGIDWMQAAIFVNDLGRWLELPLDVARLFDYPTIAILSEYLADHLQQGSSSPESIPALHDRK